MHKATIIPRGRALGMPGNRQARPPPTFLSRRRRALPSWWAGVSPRNWFWPASADFGRAVRHRAGDQACTCTTVVTRWGLSEALGTVAYGENQGGSVPRLFRGAAADHFRSDCAENIGRREIRRFVEAGYTGGAQDIRTTKRGDLRCSPGVARIRDADWLTRSRFVCLQVPGPRVGDRANDQPRNTSVPTAGAGRN